MLYSDWPSSDRYYKTLESSKWSVDMLTWHLTIELSTHVKLTQFLQIFAEDVPNMSHKEKSATGGS